MCESGHILADLIRKQDDPAESIGELGRQGRLPTREQTSYQDHPHARLLEVLEADREQTSSFGRCLAVPLVVPDAGHLRSHVGPVSDVVMNQRLGVRLARELHVAAYERVCQIWCAQTLEVHGKERHVGEHVSVAELVVELDAVQDARAVLQAEDVVGLEISVAVARHPSLNSLLEEWYAA